MQNWHVITQSTHAHELEALEFVRAGLSGTSHAFANFTFMGLDGSLNEVDLLVIGPWGFYLCEIKSRPGTISGDGQTWQWKEGTRVFSDDNPLLLAQRKCQKLKSLLTKQKSLHRVTLPFLEPVIFLSHPTNQLALRPDAAQRIFLRDGAQRSGILAALNRREGAGLKAFDHPPIGTPDLRAVLRGLQEIGLKPRSTSRVVGDYELGQLLYESPAHTVQDWEAVHVSAKGTQRLARLYLINAAATSEDRDRLAKAARRDFELIEPLDHPGLLRVDTMVTTERGPVVIYRYPKEARRLDHFLAEQGESLPVGERISILRQIAEAIAYAHEHRVIHRGLTPQSVLVSPGENGGWRSHVYNWQLGSGQMEGTDTSGTRSLHATDLLEDASTAYLAPEAIAGTNLDAPELDTFSLGALAWRLFTDLPPAASSLELATLLRDGPGYLNPASVKDGLPESLRDLIQFSANRDASMRYTAREFAQMLTDVEDELTRPEPQHVLDPRTARSGDILEGDLLVIRRLGSGSISVVFLVEVPDVREPMVLKLAAQPEYNERIKAEHAVLRKLKNPSIVNVHDSFESGGIAGFLMDCAVELPRDTQNPEDAATGTARVRYQEAETLAVRLRRYGRLEIDALQTFGDDLLKALEYVHEYGLAHRDVKPDNIGLRVPRARDRVRLILFDFSLISAPLEEIRVGTPPYLDPFLPLRKTRRWDSHAERFAAAMTLYEMAAGALPKWGDGQSAPHLLDVEVSIQPELFIPDLKERLASFFARALRRDYTKRFDTWEQMRTTWADVFQHVDEPAVPVGPQTTIPDDGATARPALPLLTSRSTAIIELGLSTRAFNALDRLGLVTVAELLDYPLRRIYRMPGVGNKTRQEILEAVQALRERLATESTPDLDAVDTAGAEKSVAPESQSIDLIARQLTPRRGGNAKNADAEIMIRFLGAEEGDGHPPGEWLSQSDVAPLLGLTRARVGQVLEKARERWAKLPPLTSVRQEISRFLRTQSGVMTHRELISAVLAARGSAFDEPQRTRLTSMVVRAAVETEKGLENPEYVEVRRAGHVFVAFDRTLADWALELANTADRLLTGAGDALPSRARAVESLQLVPRPAFSRDQECPPPEPTRLVALAASLATLARANSRLELYPADLPPHRALLLCRNSFFNTRPLTPQEVAQRVAARFPQAPSLPLEAEKLAPLLAAAEVPLRWSPDAHGRTGAFVSTVSMEAMLSRTENGSHRTHTRTQLQPMPVVPEDVAAAMLLEERLQSGASRGSFLAVSVPPDRLARAETELLRRFPLTRIDGDSLFLKVLREKARELEIDWNMVLAADAAEPESFDGQQLRRLVNECAPQLRQALINPTHTLLLTHPGLFARYGLMGMLATLRDDLGRPGGPHGLWLLIPAVVQSTLPRLNGQPVPVIAEHQYLTLPEAWLNNAHRAVSPSPA
jgi:serine/threonine protein kinase